MEENGTSIVLAIAAGMMILWAGIMLYEFSTGRIRAWRNRRRMRGGVKITSGYRPPDYYEWPTAATWQDDLWLEEEPTWDWPGSGASEIIR